MSLSRERSNCDSTTCTSCPKAVNAAMTALAPPNGRVDRDALLTSSTDLTARQREGVLACESLLGVSSRATIDWFRDRLGSGTFGAPAGIISGRLTVLGGGPLGGDQKLVFAGVADGDYAIPLCAEYASSATSATVSRRLVETVQEAVKPSDGTPVPVVFLAPLTSGLGRVLDDPLFRTIRADQDRQRDSHSTYIEQFPTASTSAGIGWGANSTLTALAPGSTPPGIRFHGQQRINRIMLAAIRGGGERVDDYVRHCLTRAVAGSLEVTTTLVPGFRSAADAKTTWLRPTRLGVIQDLALGEAPESLVGIQIADGAPESQLYRLADQQRLVAALDAVFGSGKINTRRCLNTFHQALNDTVWRPGQSRTAATVSASTGLLLAQNAATAPSRIRRRGH